MSLASRLVAGLEALSIKLDAVTQARLLQYLALIEKWNRVHNLTAVRDVNHMLSHHLMDSLAVLPHLERATSLLDVGSGAGLPGIPLAIAEPRLAVTLLDSSQKRVSFLNQCKAELKLENVNVIHQRVEDYQPGQGFDVVISRAFADMSAFVALSRRHGKPGGRLLAMKGRYPDEEIAKLSDADRVTKVVELTIPELNAHRHLVEIAVS